MPYLSKDKLCDSLGGGTFFPLVYTWNGEINVRIRLQKLKL